MFKASYLDNNIFVLKSACSGSFSRLDFSILWHISEWNKISN